jgi:diphthamide synthase (EF-2-diphthine--ammonia ligase)
VDRVCKGLNIEAIEPLWGAASEQILTDLMKEGFEATVVRVKAGLFSKEWIGRKIDGNFVRDLHKFKNKFNIHVLGKVGEYHTFVTKIQTE